MSHVDILLVCIVGAVLLSLLFARITTRQASNHGLISEYERLNRHK